MIEAWRNSSTFDAGSLSRVAVATAVMQKNIAHPTGARLDEKAHRNLVALAVEAGIEVREPYNPGASPLVQQVGRYAHAQQFRRRCRALKRVKGYAGRVKCDLRRHPV